MFRWAVAVVPSWYDESFAKAPQPGLQAFFDRGALRKDLLAYLQKCIYINKNCKNVKDDHAENVKSEENHSGEVGIRIANKATGGCK